jgi:hypothetical protein
MTKTRRKSPDKKVAKSQNNKKAQSVKIIVVRSRNAGKEMKPRKKPLVRWIWDGCYRVRRCAVAYGAGRRKYGGDGGTGPASNLLALR